MHCVIGTHFLHCYVIEPQMPVITEVKMESLGVLCVYTVHWHCLVSFF